MAAQTVSKVQYVDNETVIRAANLNAIQDAVNNHASLIDGLDSNKVDKVAGKGLSTNDYNNDAQSKLNNLPSGPELDASLGGKVDKRISGTEVYTHTGSTQGGATLTETPTAGAVPLYGTGGVLKAAAPVAANDVVRKAELDEVVDELSDSTTGLGSKAPAIIETVGPAAIASFDDGADGMPIRKLVANIEPVQDLHGYDHPWPAGGNVNKLSPANTTTPATHNELTITPYANGKYHAKKTGTSLVGNVVITLETPIPVTTSDYFTPITTGEASGAFPINLQDANGNSLCGSLLGKESLQITSAGTAAKIQFYTDKNWSGEVDIFPMISSSAVTQWSPYSNICPITGWTGAEVKRTGKNLFRLEAQTQTKNGTTFTVNADGSVTVSGTPSATAQVTIGTFQTVNGLNYRINGCPIGGSTSTYRITVAGLTTDIGNGNQFTGDGAAHTIRIDVFTGFDGTAVTFKPMIRLVSDIDDTYEPYTGTDITADWSSVAGTVYGGTLDATNGVLTVNRAYRLLNDPDKWIEQSSPTQNFRYSDKILDRKLFADSYAGLLCSYMQVNSSDPNNTARWSGVGTYYFGFRTDNLTLDQIKADAANGNIEILYNLANPITYQLTPTEVTTLLGANNIWSDAGDVEVTYCADTKLYIQQLTQPTEDDMTADHAISAGTFFMIGQKLYLSIASIASGAQIIEGTNARQLSLADALNTLSS